jgi:hypothetical protein
MNSVKPQLPTISNEDLTQLVDVLLELLAWQEKQIDATFDIQPIKSKQAQPLRVIVKWSL